MKAIKKISVVFLLAISSFGYSQNLEPAEDKIEYDEETAECWKVVLAPKDKEVKKAFKKFMKKRYDVKLKKKRDIMKVEDVTIPKISTKRINFYASITDVDGLTEVKLFGNYGYSLFFTKEKQNDEFQAVRGILVDFMNSYLPEHHQEIVNDASKAYDKYVDEDKDTNKDIEKNKEKIEELKKENEELASKLEKTKEEITQSKEKLVKVQEQFNSVKKQLSSIKR